MRIAITGGTGLVGKALTESLRADGHDLFILTRNQVNGYQKGVTYVKWLSKESDPAGEIEAVDVIINLAGESINGGRWSDERKAQIVNSRINATNEVVSIIKRLKNKPKLLINASGIGFYGTSTVDTFTEATEKAGNDFLAQTVDQWEAATLEARELGVRTVFARFGVILDKKDGALPRIALPYQLFAGGTVGSGDQWLSWIHIKDVVQGLQHVIDSSDLSGPVNFCAPEAVTMKNFGKTLGSVLNRPHWIPAPSFALRLVLGEMSMLVLEGQRVIPEKLLKSGYAFTFPTLQEALQNIYS
ncbi:TIGR01777 family oxidoreductase [Robertmurraya korlensis]|uniref:TIGR01777 family oxidoreductase n=1 Tax=Robertmurraya korlensis TaxID=519977 RepID=UPI00203F3B52|nr:TIGR01777 family oxidoreductase [Robertmurraya korlensis]MCM3601965.1 TIGR01777 family oxidoreductase [Robertmurraya korlensis]